MAFRCGQNYTDSKNMFDKIMILKSKPVKYIECNKKYESRFAKYTFTTYNWRGDLYKTNFSARKKMFYRKYVNNILHKVLVYIKL